VLSCRAPRDRADRGVHGSPEVVAKSARETESVQEPPRQEGRACAALGDRAPGYEGPSRGSGRSKHLETACPNRGEKVTGAVGLFLLFALSVTPLPDWVSMRVSGGEYPSWSSAWAWCVSLKDLVVVLLTVFWVRRRERRPLASIGLRSPSAADAILGLGGFASYVLLVTLNWRPPLGSSGSAANEALMFLPLVPGIAFSLSNAAMEETLFRGYAIERLDEILGSRYAGAAVAHAMCLIAHVFWGWDAVSAGVIAFGQLAFLYLYLWRQSVFPCFLAHALADALPTVVWPMLPESMWPFMPTTRFRR
jgi:membrane protease YdiL (CAAX protease family)